LRFSFLEVGQLEKLNRYQTLILVFLGRSLHPTLYKADLESDLEECIVPYKIDLIDFYHVDKDFKKEALNTIQIWNCPKNINLN
jgi:hypothetical protein